MKILKTALFLLIPFLAMTEGGAMYQRLVNVPLWLTDMNLMKHFHYVGRYFFFFTPPVIVIWIIVVISSYQYKGRGRILMFINHILYFSIILSTAFYFIPFLSKYVGNTQISITKADHSGLQAWAVFSMIRQVLGFIVITVYSYLLGIVNRYSI